MSETSPVITVKQEVETVLRLTLEAYAVQTEAADDLVKGNAEFHEAVLAVLNDIIEAYVAPEPVFEDTTIRVGDTVRVVGSNGLGIGKLGDEFEVTKLKETPTSKQPYATGPGNFIGGVWLENLEKVQEVQEDATIRVGDTVRITEAAKLGVYPAGTEFEVTAIEDSFYTLTTTGEKLGPHIYKGDPNGYGVWSNFVEKVHA